MKVKAIYRADEDVRPGEVVHCVDYDGGGFVVSSKEVGVAIQNFMHYATISDIRTLTGYLGTAYADALMEIVRNERTDDDVKRDMMEAHAEGWHSDIPREFCPDCERETGHRGR